MAVTTSVDPRSSSSFAQLLSRKAMWPAQHGAIIGVEVDAQHRYAGRRVKPMKIALAGPRISWQPPMKAALVLAAVLAAGIACAQLAQAETGDQSDAAQAVATAYAQKQKRCTPSMTPQFQSISWDSFYPASFGSGSIVDANSHLGGPFKVYYTNPKIGPAISVGDKMAVGQWLIEFDFC
jgi:hypothetical protein